MDFTKTFFLAMFTLYHAIIFAVLFVGGAGVIFQTSTGQASLVRFPFKLKLMNQNSTWILIRLPVELS